MKLVLQILTFALIAVSCSLAAGNQLHCDAAPPHVPKDWIDMTDGCTKAVRDQIQMEVDASFAYLAMAAHYSRDTVNRPGFAEFYFKAAKEERHHAMVLIDYLNMRGDLGGTLRNLINFPDVKNTTWENAADSLENALHLENKVTQSIRNVIIVCETDKNREGELRNDYHLVDYLTGVYLEEQYKALREIAGKLSTLRKMMDHHGEIGEFLYDKTLLE